jgi:heavy metal sensor kinase
VEALRQRPDAQSTFSTLSLRLRLTLWYSAVLAFVLFFFGTAVYQLVGLILINQVDGNILAAKSEVERVLVVGRVLNNQILLTPQLDELVSGASTFIQVWRADGSLAAQSEELENSKVSVALDQGGLQDSQGIGRTVKFRSRSLRVFTYPIYAEQELVGYLQIATPLWQIENTLNTLLVILVGGGVAAVLLAAMIGWLSASRALRPINAITQTALQISRADDLSRRIVVKNPNDEVGRMSIAFNETLERLERQFNAQRRFLADVSHELRTPLTAIRGNVELMQRMGVADPESLQDIRSESERMTRLVGDLLVLAQADSGNLPLERKPVDLDALLLEVCREVQVLASHLHVSVSEIDQARVIGDRDRLKQLVLNLVTNAIKYTPEGGRVTLGLGQVKNWARLTVTDTGIGIPPDELPRIFDRFYRVDKARSRAMGGAGLGLSIAQRIAQMHSGRIEAASEGVNKGTTFALWLPLAPDAKAAVPETAVTQPVKRRSLPLLRRQ